MFEVRSRDRRDFDAIVGNYRFTLANADRIANPSVWDSALTITNLLSGRSCSTESMLIKSVYVAAETHVAVVTSYSGSTGYLDVIDSRTCRKTAPEVAAFVNSFEIRGRRITVLPDCEDDSAGGLVQCHAARVFAVHPSGMLEFLKEESLNLTERKLG